MSYNVERAFLNLKWREARHFHTCGDLPNLKTRVAQISLIYGDLEFDSGLRQEALKDLNEVYAWEADLISQLINRGRDDYFNRKEAQEEADDDAAEAMWAEARRLAESIQDESRRRELLQQLNNDQEAWERQQERKQRREIDCAGDLQI